MRNLIKPKGLKSGAVIGISSFASLPRELDAVDRGVEFLEKHGLRVKIGRCAKRPCSDEEKAAELMRMFTDSEIDAIISVRGGYGTLRYINKLDYKVIKEHPKPLIGFSDIGSLLMAIYVKTGLVGFYGPMVASNFAKGSEFSFRNLFKVLDGEKIAVRTEHEPIFGGIAKGRLVGGCLSILMTLICTDFDFSLKDSILFFEDVNEEGYRIDRMLTHLMLTGKLEEVKGIAVGRLTPPKGTSEDSLVDVVAERLRRLGVPVAYGFQFGHMTDIITLPIGVEAELDADSGTLKLLEPAVERT